MLQNDTAALILRHELTHLRHLDPLWSFCRTAAVVAYWWNPLVWLAAIVSKRDAELACDEAVAVGLLDSERIAYARAILAQAPRRGAALSLAGPPVKERILFLTKKQRTSVLCVVLALILVLSATGCSFAELTRQKSGEITLPEAAGETGPSADPTARQEGPVQDQPQLLHNDGTYDPSQPLQAWELARADGVQTGMTQAQVEAITGPLTENKYGVLVDDQNISYRFWDRSGGEPKLMEMTWSGKVINDELVYTTAQDAPAFRGICLGDPIGDVLAKLPCTDRELRYQQTQYVYGQAGDADYAVLHLIGDSYYSLSFGIAGQWRASVDFSRVQQRVFHIVIYAETYWQEAEQAGEETAARAQTMTLSVPSGEKYTLSEEDTAALQEIFSEGSMTMLENDPESVCVYQFDIRNHSYLLDETLDTVEMIVWMDTEHYDYYQKRLTDADAETLQTVIDRYTQGAEGSKRQTAILREVRADSVTVEHITLLNSALEEDLRTLKGLNIPPEAYQYGYYREDSGEIYTYKVEPDTSVTIYDISQVYGAGDDRLYTFETWQDFVAAVQANEGLCVPPYTLTLQDGVVVKIEEKFYN